MSFNDSAREAGRKYFAHDEKTDSKDRRGLRSIKESELNSRGARERGQTSQLMRDFPKGAIWETHLQVLERYINEGRHGA